jgi:hypothetical protein
MAYTLNTTYLYFTATDYTGAPALSTYTLDITPLRFIPDFTTCSLLSSQAIVSNKTIRWDFGDGTYSTDLTASHAYSWAGNYNVHLTIYDQNGHAYDSSYSPIIQVFDFIPTQTQFQGITNPAILNDKYIGPLTVNVYNSWQSYPAVSATGYTVNFYASGAGGDYESLANFANDKWSHLRTLHQFLTVETLYNTKQFVPIESLTATSTELYAYNNGGTLQFCDPGTEGSVLVGTTGYCEVYFTDDSISNIGSPTLLFATPDTSKLHDFFTQQNNLFNYVDYPPYGYQNIVPSVLSITRTKYNPATYIEITTTGIAGEGNLSSTAFDIPYASWQQTEIPYVITLKDYENYTTKAYPPLSSSTANPNVHGLTACDIQTGIIYTDKYNNVHQLEGVTFHEDFAPQAPQSLGSFYKGYFISQFSMENCQLTASVRLTDPIYNTTHTIYGKSNTFNIYSTGGQFYVTKVNENWNASGFYDSLRYQETLLGKPNFFDQFLGTIVGGVSAYPYELGKTIYEKIANFTSNKSDIDKVNVDSLLSFCDELQVQFENYNYDFPPQLQRLINILSIKQKNLWGSPNTYQYAFNNGSQSVVTDIGIGINLGSKLSVQNDFIVTCTPIVAYELFSGNYSLVNGNCINGKSPGDVVPLSSYTNDWGWGLVAPANSAGLDINNYYNFYRFKNVTDGIYYDNIINWSDPLTTLSQTQSSYSGWSNDNGLMQTMISYELTHGLNLFTSAVQIALT